MLPTPLAILNPNLGTVTPSISFMRERLRSHGYKYMDMTQWATASRARDEAEVVFREELLRPEGATDIRYLPLEIHRIVNIARSDSHCARASHVYLTSFFATLHARDLYSIFMLV